MLEYFKIWHYIKDKGGSGTIKSVKTWHSKNCVLQLQFKRVSLTKQKHICRMDYQWIGKTIQKKSVEN